MKSQTVSSDPDVLSVSANGEYVYVAFEAATTMTLLQLAASRIAIDLGVKQFFFVVSVLGWRLEICAAKSTYDCRNAI